MHQAFLRTATSTILAWPLSGHERMAADAAATALSGAGASGALGGASPAVRERLQDVVTAMSSFVQVPDIDGVVTGGHWRAWGQMQHFMRVPGRTAADSLRLAKDSLWNAADAAAFFFRKEDAPRAKSNLGQALHALQDSFSPAHVKRERDDRGRLVIKDLFEYTAQDPKQHGKGDETFRTGEAAQSSYSGLGQATVLASTILLAYFIQRCLGREADAIRLRQSLNDIYLVEQAS